MIVLLDFPACSEERLSSYLQHLDLRIDAWAVSTLTGEEKSPVDASSSRDLIASEPVLRLEDPVTLVQQSDTSDEVRLQLVWETTLTLGRPRTRSVDQTITFIPVATVVEASEDQNSSDDACLEPFTISEPNVLSPLGPLPGVDHPFLPLSSLKKVIPAIKRQAERIRLKYEASKPVPANAAIIPRLKYSKLNVSQIDPVTIASLDLEVVPFSKVKGRIESIDVSLANGKATSMMPDFLPMPCEARDCITFLYQLHSLHRSGSSTPIEPTTNSSVTAVKPNIDVLSIHILMYLFLSETTTATIRTSWTTNVDFSLALNPAFGAPSQTLQRTNRPNSLNFTPYPDPSTAKSRDSTNAATKSSSRTASTSLQHQMIPKSIPRQPLSSTLSVSFIATEQRPRVGVPFSWRVLVVNNSPKPVKLAIVPLPRIQRPTTANQHFAKRHAPKASNSSVPPVLLNTSTPKTHARNVNGGSIAKAVVEEHVLYALHHQSSSAGAAAVPPEADLISLTAELRIGPLGVRQCHEAEIKFIAYKSGVFMLDAIRVVDLAGESEGNVGAINDIRELPEIIVIEAEEEVNDYPTDSESSTDEAYE